MLDSEPVGAPREYSCSHFALSVAVDVLSVYEQSPVYDIHEAQGSLHNHHAQGE